MGHPNYFESLELPLTPFLDEEVLKQNYLRLSSNAHPDRAKDGSDETGLDASLINEAYNQLSKMPTRLRHLLVQLTGELPESLKQIPEAVGDRFMEVGEVLLAMAAEEEVGCGGDVGVNDDEGVGGGGGGGGGGGAAAGIGE